MSEHSVSSVIAPTPERGSADIASNLPDLSFTPIAEVEQEPIVAEKPLAERVQEIEGLPSTVKSFHEVLSKLPDQSTAYSDKKDFESIVDGDDTELSEQAKDVFEYAKSQLYVTMSAEGVNMDSFKRKTVAFPENPKAGKVAYIIEDLKKALAETTDASLKSDFQQSIVHMEKFAEIVDEDDESLGSEYVKRYAELANNPAADPKELEAAKQSLLALQERNMVKAAAYKIISYYFPSAKAQNRSIESVVTLRPQKILGVDPAQQAAGRELASQKAEQLEEAEYKLSVFRDSDKKGETGVAAEIAKRANSRGILTKKPNQQTKLKQLLYTNKNYEVFALQHEGDREGRFNKLAMHVTKEAIRLQASVKTRLAAERDPQIMPDLTKAIKEAREEIEAGNAYDELEVYAKLQSAVLDGFDKFILGEQSTETKRSIGRKALSVTGNGLAKGLDGLVYVMADKPWELVDKGREAAKKRLNSKKQSAKEQSVDTDTSDDKKTEEKMSRSRKLRANVNGILTNLTTKS